MSNRDKIEKQTDFRVNEAETFQLMMQRVEKQLLPKMSLAVAAVNNAYILFKVF